MNPHENQECPSCGSGDYVWSETTTESHTFEGGRPKSAERETRKATHYCCLDCSKVWEETFAG